MTHRLTRRALVQAGALLGTQFLVGSAFASQADDLNAIVNDPDAPVVGNPKGDLTIVEFFDYNCPFCKGAEPNLARMVKADGNIRLVYSDWPILSEASIKGAQWALAAQYQGKYNEVHDALMAIPGTKIPEQQMRQAIIDAGIDMDRIDSDLQGHADQITAHLRRNLAHADMLQLQGTPAYLVGIYRVTSALTYDGFKRVAADARARARVAKP